MPCFFLDVALCYCSLPPFAPAGVHDATGRRVQGHQDAESFGGHLRRDGLRAARRRRLERDGLVPKRMVTSIP